MPPSVASRTAGHSRRSAFSTGLQPTRESLHSNVPTVLWCFTSLGCKPAPIRALHVFWGQQRSKTIATKKARHVPGFFHTITAGGDQRFGWVRRGPLGRPDAGARCWGRCCGLRGAGSPPRSAWRAGAPSRARGALRPGCAGAEVGGRAPPRLLPPGRPPRPPPAFLPPPMPPLSTMRPNTMGSAFSFGLGSKPAITCWGISRLMSFSISRKKPCSSTQTSEIASP